MIVSVAGTVRPVRTGNSEFTAAGGAGLRAFANIAERWSLTVAEQLKLLGIPSRSTFFKWRREREPRLQQDTLERLSYLLGIFKALGVLYSERLADEWVQRPNTNPLFGGVTPLEYMVRGGLPAMQAVRRLLDARRAG